MTFKFKSSPLRGKITLPPSKSYLHRYIVASALSQKHIKLTNVSEICEDIKDTLNIVHELFGTNYLHIKNSLHILPNNNFDQIKNTDNKKYYIKGSAFTLRSLLPIIVNYSNNKTFHLFTGFCLKKRPLDTYLCILKNANLKINFSNRCIIADSGYIKAQKYIFTENISSQFITGLLFSLPMLDKDSEIYLKDIPPSVGYIKMTIDVLNKFSINIKHSPEFNHFYIQGRQQYVNTKKNFSIEYDYSSKVYWQIINHCNKDKNIEFHNDLCYLHSLQPDFIFEEILSNDQNEVNINSTPDIAPILAIYLMNNKGGIIYGINRLKYKESDRLNSIVNFLRKSNVSYIINKDYLRIEQGKLKSTFYKTFNDHRITMSLITACTLQKNCHIYLDELKSINKSYVNYLKDYTSLGGCFNNVKYNR